jgi:hypothetical protein
MLEQIYLFLQQKLRTIQQLVNSHNQEKANPKLTPDQQLQSKINFLKKTKEVIEQTFDCKKLTLIQESSNES